MFKFKGTIAKADNRPVVISFDTATADQVSAIVLPSEFPEDKTTIIEVINDEIRKHGGITLA